MRSPPTRSVPIRLAVLALAAAAVVACDGRLERAPAGSSGAAAAGSESHDVATPAEDGFTSEAERTRAMEAQAADLKQQYEEAMSSAATPDEKIRAYQEFEQGRQELNEMSEDVADDGDAYAPPPAP